MSAIHGRLTSIKIDNSGGTLTDISNQIKTSSLQNSAQEIDVTAYQDTARQYISDFPDGTFNIEGNAAATVMAHLYGILGVSQTLSVEYGPEGSATGKRKYTFESVMTALNDSGASTGQANQFTATFRVAGAVTVGTFA